MKAASRIFGSEVLSGDGAGSSIGRLDPDVLLFVIRFGGTGRVNNGGFSGVGTDLRNASNRLVVLCTGSRETGSSKL